MKHAGSGWNNKGQRKPVGEMQAYVYEDGEIAIFVGGAHYLLHDGIAKKIAEYAMKSNGSFQLLPQ